MLNEVSPEISKWENNITILQRKLNQIKTVTVLFWLDSKDDFSEAEVYLTIYNKDDVSHGDSR